MIILVWACGISQIKAESPQLRKHADKAPHSGLGPLAEIRRFDESPTIAEGSMVSKQKEAPQNGGGAEPALPTRFMVSAVLVGSAILAYAFLAVIMRVELPYTRLFVYTGIATLLTAVGASATVLAKNTGQRVAVGGAAAVAIALSWMIPPDPETPKIKTMTYYLMFPDQDKVARTPGELKATAIINDDLQHPREVHLQRSPGGDLVKLTIANVLARDDVVLKIRSDKENKSWESSPVQFTESFMKLNAMPGD